MMSVKLGCGRPVELCSGPTAATSRYVPPGLQTPHPFVLRFFVEETHIQRRKLLLGLLWYSSRPRFDTRFGVHSERTTYALRPFSWTKEPRSCVSTKNRETQELKNNRYIMDTTSSPPMSPIRQYMSPLEATSPTTSTSYRERLHRRTSSLSSNHDRSNPATPRSSRHRFSNASQLSISLRQAAGDEPVTPGGAAGGGGNLADELDQLDDDDVIEGDDEDDLVEEMGDASFEHVEAARDSGIDVSYASASSKRGSPNHVRNFSKPFSGMEKPPDEEREINEANKEDNHPRQQAEEDKFSPELEELMHAIHRMTSYTSTADPLVERAIALLQDLGNQTGVEAAVQRLTTSTNSTTSHLTTQSRSMQALSQTLYPMFLTFSAPLDPQIIEEVVPMVEALLKESLPQPDPLALQKLQKLHRDTGEVVSALAGLTDTLQMGKQITNTAARHLRTTQTVLMDIRQERDQAEQARQDLASNDWNEKLKSRWCANQCKDIVSGFEDTCDALRNRLEAAVAAGA